MIKGIGLENFKAFKECAYIDFKKINVLLGPNSSGKSSYLKGLLTLQNTMKNTEDEPAITLNERIGDFQSIVYGKVSNGNVSFTVTFEENNEDLLFDFNNSTRNTSKYSTASMMTSGFLYLALIVIAAISQNEKTSETDEKNQIVDDQNKFVTAIEQYAQNPVEKITFTICEPSPKKPNKVGSMHIFLKNQDFYDISLQNDGESYQIHFNNVLLEQSKKWIMPYKIFFRPYDPGDLSHYSISDLSHITALYFIFYKLEQKIRRFTKGLIHIEPFRNEPERSNMVANFNFGSVGSKGENMVTSFIGLKNAFEEKDQKKIDYLNDINHWLNEFQLAESVDVEELGNNNYSLVIKNKFTKIPCNIVDVGVGTSQLLPIVMESVISPEHSTLLIEEPETHIHPNAQAKLAELFVACSQKYNKQFIIETHSMYLLRMLQILVAKKELKPEDIGVYYFEQDANGSRIVDMKLKDNGQFEKAFPKGFFDVPLNLSSTLMEFM